MKKEKSELKNIKFSKLYVLVALFIFGIILFRARELSLEEVVEGVNIQNFASNRTTTTETLYSKRGTIYDINGNALAQNITSYTLIAYLSPSRTGESKIAKHVIDKENTAEQLSQVLDIPKEQILKYLSKDAYQVELGPKAKNLTELKKSEIEALRLPGIDFVETQQRYYPFGRFASYIMGYAKKKEILTEEGETTEDLVGEMGIESYYNKELTGKNGFVVDPESQEDIVSKLEKSKMLLQSNEENEGLRDNKMIYKYGDMIVRLFDHIAKDKDLIIA